MAFFQILGGAITGKRPWSDVLADMEKGEAQVGAVVVPNLEKFVEQFFTDFGAQALALAEGEAPAVLSGSKTIQQAAADITPQITADATQDAEKDGTVALNAVRVQLTALATAPAALALAAPVAPEEPAPAAEPAAVS